MRKCPYCDFNSHQVRGGIPEDDYVAALIADLEAALPLVWGRPVQTVFIGGGTPSLLSAAALDRLLSALRARLPLAPGAEITLEANPGTLETEKFRDFRSAGINRLSLGVQSFGDRQLAALGRIHDGAAARRAAEFAAREFDNFNLDLMYGLPDQDVAGALADIETALGFAPPHLSAYNLTLEPNTLFQHAPPAGLPDEDACAQMQEEIERRLAAADFVHYETSAYARPGRQCRHNLNYWLFGDYLGIGAGAHGKLTLSGRILRQARQRQPRQYMEAALAGNAIQSEAMVTAEDLPLEFMMNALRLTGGFAETLFAERTGLPPALVAPALARAEAEGLIERAAGRIAPTLKGQRHLNALLLHFVP